MACTVTISFLFSWSFILSKKIKKYTDIQYRFPSLSRKLCRIRYVLEKINDSWKNNEQRFLTIKKKTKKFLREFWKLKIYQKYFYEENYLLISISIFKINLNISQSKNKKQYLKIYPSSNYNLRLAKISR